MRPEFVSLIVSIAIVAAHASTSAADTKTTFHVATTGNDAWSGLAASPNKNKTDGPFASLARARDAVRQLKTREGGLKNPITILVHAGTYHLSEPFVLSPEDSGSERCPVTYAAAPGDTVIVSGGRTITGWKKACGKLWSVRIEDAAAGKWYFHQLFVNGERRTRARTPNEGYLRTAGTVVPLSRDRTKASPLTKTGFRFNNSDLQHWDNLDDVNVIAYHAWTASWHYIADVNTIDHTVKFTNSSGWPMSWWEKEQRFHVENYFEALDSPGEWYLNRKTGELFYWPKPGENMRKAHVAAPVLQTLVQFAGDPDNNKFVEHVLLRGLAFQHADWDFDRTKPADGQAAVFLGAAISGNGVLNCTLENCEIAHIGEYAVNFARGCQGNRIEHCHIHDLGAGGVRIGEYARTARQLPASDRVRTNGNVVHNNFIHDGGCVFAAGIGVWIGQSASNVVSHNEICDFFYSGVSAGWTWGYGPHEARGNVIEFNHIHHLGKGVLSDMGGIYTLGMQPGTIERNNVIHDVLSYSYGGWGIYTDEGSSDILIENNIVYLTKSGGFHQHYGRENILRNNIFALAAEGQLIRSRQEDHVSFTMEHNIVFQDDAPLFGGRWSNKNFRLDNNLYFRAGGEPLFDGNTLEEWREQNGQDAHSTIADPRFISAASADFRLRSDSPALKLGFKPIDTSTVGLVGTKAWVAAPKRVRRAPTVFPEWQELTCISDNFEKTAVGKAPAGATIAGGEAPACLAVTDEAAASGRHSLKVGDAQGLAQPWHPHFYYKPNFNRGTLVLSFDMRVEKGGLPAIECRDASTPYRVGPNIHTDVKGQLYAGKQLLMPVKPGEWLHFDILCPLGKNANGTYDLTVKPQHGAPQKFTVDCGHKEFQRCQWFGVMSMANAPTLFYLDNIKLTTAK